MKNIRERLELFAQQLKSSPSPLAVHQIGEALENLAAQIGLPTAADLDVVAAEAEVAEKTK
jgi:hypothetical protein